MHSKDDYRSAVSFARERIKNSEMVWWSASLAGAEYYGLSLNAGSTPHAIIALGLDSESISALPEPKWIILSKPDLFDPKGVVEHYVAENEYRLAKVLPAFRIYSRKQRLSIES